MLQNHPNHYAMIKRMIRFFFFFFSFSSCRNRYRRGTKFATRFFSQYPAVVCCSCVYIDTYICLHRHIHMSMCACVCESIYREELWNWSGPLGQARLLLCPASVTTNAHTQSEGGAATAKETDQSQCSSGPRDSGYFGPERKTPGGS